MIHLFIKKHQLIEEKLIQEIHKHGKIKKFKKGEVIIKQDEYIKSFWVVLKGKVRVYQEYDAKEILVFYLEDFDVSTFSVFACYQESRSLVNAIAEENCEILEIPTVIARDWPYNYKSWHHLVIRTFSKSGQMLLSKYSSLAFSTISDRLYYYLKQESNNSIIKRSHQQIANELGTTREVISRLLKKMEIDGILELGQKEIKLIN